jgi:hypothetical protein
MTFKDLKYFLGCTFIIALASCAKKDQTSAPFIPANNCKITAASITSGTGTNLGNYNFAYNSDGKLEKSIFGGPYADTAYYSYNASLIYRSVAAGIYSSVDTITLNNAGFMVHDKAVISGGIYMTNYVYDANGDLQTLTQLQDSVATVFATYTFTNGDNTLIVDGPSLDTLVYDPNKLAVTGNIDQFHQELYIGGIYSKSKHLLMSDSHGFTTNYTYTYADNGNITSIKMTSGTDSQTITYTYDCN